ncbi:arylsulfotransferase family protein [Conexibacter sp. CPCC 206217]|uniref:arylsulfotransferase family protein n=1 Tax=Conexibacter sp. CPCC 206217 TaxID=3064574 RepID=UPI0027189C69|nr:arylsulfotransferase family protein [Conexibacter sp. CPCC 206217]MDO8212940.1 arylsulfotransferase family protein [Conexibacter sp. CPCC 206217]
MQGTQTPTLPPPPPPRTRGRRRTGRKRVAVALGALVLVAVGAAAWELLTPPAEPELAGIESIKAFHSRPLLDPDALTVATPAAPGVAPGFIFLAVKRGPGQDGPMIVDNRGRPVWFHAVGGDKTATAFKVQQYRGRPVLTWWEGNTHLGHGHGEYVVMDTHYREIARVRSVASELPDHHDFQLTDRGTALMTLYIERRADLSKVGGPRDGTIVESRIQEVDVASGRLVWEWRSADHVPVTEGMTAPKDGKPHDYFHVNAIDVDRDGDLLVSARNMHAIYKIDRPSGRIEWRLGGRRSDFRIGRGARFAFQHDVRRQPDGTLTLFDNEATPAKAQESRGLQLRLNRRTMTAKVVRQYRHPDGLLAGAEGNLQTLPNRDVFISWGPEERISEFSRGGRLLFDLALPAGSDSYQAFRFPWRGRPLDRPAIAARRHRDGRRTTVWASWNGATLVRRWRVLAGPRPGRLRPIGRPLRRTGFETALRVRTKARFVAVRAVGPDGRALRASRAVKPRGG